ncbi:MAG TPA: zinc ribbon domain-containing protein [Actinocrinis sp.]|nr:zinc ribbon domain-containing protein [Actinocrinis sp.]
MYCSACGAAVDQGAGFCASCGTPAPGFAPTGPPPPRPIPVPSAFAPRPAAPPSAAGRGAPPDPVTTIELRRLGTGDLIALAGTVLLFVSLYLPWYSLSFSDPTLGTDTTFLSTSALGAGAGGWRFLIFVVCLLVAGYLFARTMIRRPTRRMPLPHWQLLAVMCGLNMLLTLMAFLIKPGDGATVAGVSFSWSFGAPLGLAASVLALVGAVVRRSAPELLDPLPRYSGGSRAAQEPPAAYAGSTDPGTMPTAPIPPGAPGASRAPRPSRRSLTHHHHHR